MEPHFKLCWTDFATQTSNKLHSYKTMERQLGNVQNEFYVTKLVR